jgi:hypothetical protein
VFGAMINFESSVSMSATVAPHRVRWPTKACISAEASLVEGLDRFDSIDSINEENPVMSTDWVFIGLNATVTRGRRFKFSIQDDGELTSQVVSDLTGLTGKLHPFPPI